MSLNDVEVTKLIDDVEKTKQQDSIINGMNAVDDVQVKGLLIGMYMQWRNDYLSVEKFAEHNGISEVMCEIMLNEGKRLWKGERG